MNDLVAARVVLVFHIAFLAFVVFGGVLVTWRRRWAWLHLPALAWGVWIVTSHGVCPLTVLENHLLQGAGRPGYDGGFMDHYLVPVLYPPGLTQTVQTLLGIALAIWSGLLYVLALRGKRMS